MSILFFTSCERQESVNVDQNRIYSDLNYTYNANSSASTITATFRLDNSSGDKLELTYPSRITFNGEGLAWKNGMGHYSMNRNGSLGSGTFVFYDISGKEFSNSVSNLNSIEIPFGMNVISKSGNFFLPWNGVPLVAGETIKVTISDGDQSGSKVWTITSAGSGHIILDQYKLNQLMVGSANIQIEREVSSSLTHSNLAGGRLNTSYLGRKIAINIIN